jgi:hypothetical protein
MSHEGRADFTLPGIKVNGKYMRLVLWCMKICLSNGDLGGHPEVIGRLKIGHSISKAVGWICQRAKINGNASG